MVNEGSGEVVALSGVKIEVEGQSCVADGGFANTKRKRDLSSRTARSLP